MSNIPQAHHQADNRMNENVIFRGYVGLGAPLSTNWGANNKKKKEGRKIIRRTKKKNKMGCKITKEGHKKSKQDGALNY